MNIYQRNNVNIIGGGRTTILFSHGFGCDQNVWRFLHPKFEKYFQIVLFDLVGSGKSDLSAYDFQKYSVLDGYADDILEIIEATAYSPVIFVGHSVSAMIGLIASIKNPKKFSLQVMVSPSPCYINKDDYTGGFCREDIEELCATMDENYLGWSSNIAPAIMGSSQPAHLKEELTNSFCRTDPNIAKHFARTMFFADHRELLAKSITPALILQCSEDFIAPISVGNYMKETMPMAKLHIIENIGHCPHLSAPTASALAMKKFFSERGYS